MAYGMGPGGGKLPSVGVKAVIQNYNQFLAGIGVMNKAVAGFGKGKNNFATKLGIQFANATTSMNMMTVAAAALRGALMLLAAAAAAVIAIIAGVIALGIRGAGLGGIAESFDRITASIGVLSDKLLIDMRAASAGTISDFNLMKNANLALAGVTQQFGAQFASALPRILEIARVQSRATGQSVDFLFNSLVNGIKRAEPRLIDNTGIIIKIGEANEQYARSMGITVQEMTLYDRQMAVLQATLEAGASAVENLGDSHETAREKMQRAGAQISNIFDRLGMAVQPLFEPILDLINAVLTAISNFVTNGGKYIAAIAQMVGNLFKPVIDIVSNFAQSLADPEAIRGFFLGGARMIGALAGGIAQAANQYLFPVVIRIAQFIRDFLMGMSPPRKGPLHTIDVGGMNLIRAYMEGMTNADFRYIETLAQRIRDTLAGGHGRAAAGLVTIEGIEERLARLDRELRPVREHLEIVRAVFESIAAPARLALEQIENQMDDAVRALQLGQAGSAERVRALDAERAHQQSLIDRAQYRVDRAEMRVAQAEASRIVEMTHLEIIRRHLQARKDLLDALREENTLLEEGAEEAENIRDALTGGGGSEPTGEGSDEPRELGAGGEAIEAGGGVFDLLGFNPEDIELAGQELTDAFNAGAGGAFDEFTANAENLTGLLEDIGNIDLGQALEDRFREWGAGIIDWAIEWTTQVEKQIMSIPTSIVKWFTDGFAKLGLLLTGWIDSSLTWAITWTTGVQKTIVAWFEQNKTSISQWFIDIGTVFSNWTMTAVNWVVGWTSSTLASIALWITTIVSTFQKVVILAGYWFDQIGIAIQTQIDIIAANIAAWLIALFGPDTAGSIINYFKNLPSDIVSFLADFMNTINNEFISPVSSAFQNFVDSVNALIMGTGAEGEVSLQGIWNSFMTFLQSIPSAAGAALQGIGQAAWINFAVPLIGVINSVIGGFEQFINNIGDLVASSADTLAPLMDALAPGSGIILRAAAQDLRGAGQITIPRISTEMPAALMGSATRGARGGLFEGGVMEVGERGREWIAPANRIAVFPNNFVRAVEGLNSLMSAQTQYQGGSVVNNYSYDYSQTNGDINLNGGNNSQDAARRIAMRRAFS